MASLLTDRRALIDGGGAAATLGLGALAACGSKQAGPSNLAGVTTRVATYRDNAQGFFKEAGVESTPYRLPLAQFASGTLITEAINARDMGRMSEIPPIFIANTTGVLVMIVDVLKGDVNNQVVLVPKGSTLMTIVDPKGKRSGFT